MSSSPRNQTRPSTLCQWCSACAEPASGKPCAEEVTRPDAAPVACSLLAPSGLSRDLERVPGVIDRGGVLPQSTRRASVPAEIAILQRSKFTQTPTASTASTRPATRETAPRTRIKGEALRDRSLRRKRCACAPSRCQPRGCASPCDPATRCFVGCPRRAGAAASGTPGTAHRAPPGCRRARPRRSRS